jgi:pimeloyl-ACP methyl ester carboxylesterase
MLDLRARHAGGTDGTDASGSPGRNGCHPSRSGMSEIKHVVLIHGMGGCTNYWAPARAAFGYRNASGG